MALQPSSPNSRGTANRVLEGDVGRASDRDARLGARPWPRCGLAGAGRARRLSGRDDADARALGGLAAAVGLFRLRLRLPGRCRVREGHDVRRASGPPGADGGSARRLSAAHRRCASARAVAQAARGVAQAIAALRQERIADFRGGHAGALAARRAPQAARRARALRSALRDPRCGPRAVPERRLCAGAHRGHGLRAAHRGPVRTGHRRHELRRQPSCMARGVDRPADSGCGLSPGTDVDRPHGVLRRRSLARNGRVPPRVSTGCPRCGGAGRCRCRPLAVLWARVQARLLPLGDDGRVGPLSAHAGSRSSCSS